MPRKLHKNTGADGEDDADCEWESEPLGEGQKKFDTRLTRVLLVRINRRQRSRGIAGGENLFCFLISVQTVGASLAPFACIWSKYHHQTLRRTIITISRMHRRIRIHDKMSFIRCVHWIEMVNAALDLEEEIFRDVPSNQGRQRQRMIPHFLSPILLCRRQVASITLGPHLIRGRPPTDRRISGGGGHWHEWCKDVLEGRRHRARFYDGKSAMLKKTGCTWTRV